MNTLPNLLSASRLFATILVFVLVLVDQPWAFLTATALFVLASLTDFFDGYLARRLKVVSSFGAFFVSAILIALVQVGLVPAWIVFVIVTREFLVTSLRSIAAEKGKKIPPSMWGKQKTFITLVAMAVLLLAKGLGAHQLSLFPLMLTFNSQTVNAAELLLLLSNILLIVAVIWTAFSGIDYTIGALPLFQKEGNTSKV